MNTNPFLEPVNLVKCSIRERSGKRRSRYIEVEHFRLWEYFVTHRHGLAVEEKARFLWIPQQTYESARESYQTSGQIESVNRIIISLFHPEFGYDSVLQRFATKSDSQALFDVLKAHLSHERIEGKATGSEVVPGYAIEHVDAERQFSRFGSARVS